MAFLMCGTAFAADWSSWKISVDKEEKITDGRIRYHLKDAAGNAFTLLADRSADDGVVRRAAETARALFGWSKLKLRSLRLFYLKGKFRAIALPSLFICNKKDVARYMPAGMAFFYTDKLAYDFRMVKDNISMKIRGLFSTRPEFEATLANAVGNPLAYASRSNHMARIDDLNRRMSALTYKHHKLQKRFDLLVNALLYFRNTGFLRGPRKIKPAVVQRVVALKRNKPALTVDQIRTILEKEKIKVSGKEVHLILAVFFNDFKK